MRWNGKGKEYNNNALIFEGEYLNGKKWNGKGYDINDILIYELKNGNGNIREYKHGELIFLGENLNSEEYINGKEYYKGQLIFEGEYLNEKKTERENYIIIKANYYLKVNI